MIKIVIEISNLWHCDFEWYRRGYCALTGLCTHLYGVPGTTKGVTKIEVIQLVNQHAVEQCGGKDVNPLGDFRLIMSNDLCSGSQSDAPL